MSTTIRPEVSVKSRYWIEKHRYYELKHFCLQYPIWKKAYNSLDGLSSRPADLARFKTTEHGDPTARCAIAKANFLTKIEMIERVAKKTDFVLANYILKGVTEGVSYEYLSTNCGIPCGKDTYYDRYRRFFWLLSKERD